MFQTKVVEKIKTLFCVSEVFRENRVVYEVMWRGGGDMAEPVLSGKYVVFMPLN
jgi:hypothetical protein